MEEHEVFWQRTPEVEQTQVTIASSQWIRKIRSGLRDVSGSEQPL